MTVIEISDEKAAALKAKAAAEGLTLEQWLDKLAADHTVSALSRRQAAAARIREISRRTKPDPDGLTVQDYIDNDRP